MIEDYKTVYGKWIRFVHEDELKKTHIWSVQTNDTGYELGIIKWHPSWRKYCFFPGLDTVFENICLHEIAEFIKQKMAEKKLLLMNPTQTEGDGKS